MTEITIPKIDFDALMTECERLNREGRCSNCEEWRYVCWCGVCFSCHDDYFHEDLPDDPFPAERSPANV